MQMSEIELFSIHWQLLNNLEIHRIFIKCEFRYIFNRLDRIIITLFNDIVYALKI